MRINRLLLLFAILMVVNQDAYSTISMSVEFPADWDGLNGNPGPISCDESYPEDEYGNPSPELTGSPESQDCDNLGITYEDQILPLCGGSSGTKTIIRQWVVVDWCVGQTYFHDQSAQWQVLPSLWRF